MDKYKIGYTTGVFDLFHVGHLNILKNAKSQCDYLIVGVSTDELVQDYKHKTPAISFHDRYQIVEAIKYVDKVVPQVTMNKMEAWKELHFDVFFHDDDWKSSSLYNGIEEQLKQVGCSIVFLPHTEGVSSSLIKEEIERKK
jgi:glycerol-3-phosphate cytidylyltransferase